MEFYDITDDEPVRPGEMVFYTPRHSIVVCAGIVDDKMRAFDRGSFLEDDVELFKKIRMTKKEYVKRTHSRCKGCGGGKRSTNPVVMPAEPTTTGGGCKGCGGKKLAR